MTASTVPSRLYIPQPFASKTGAELTPIALVSGSTPNFEDGFPSQFSAPKSAGGSYVTRGQINAIGNLASQNQFCDACGSVITFDPALATKIGGYPCGAVLEWVSGTEYYKVISLADNNMHDFRGTTDTDLYPTVINGTIDGVHWACAVMKSDVIAQPIVLADVDLGEIDAVTKMTAISMNAASFVTPRNGAVSVAMTLGEIVTGGESGVYTYAAVLSYLEPGATQAATRNIITNSNESGASAESATRLPAGTLCSILLSFGNVHFKSVKLKATIV